MVEAERAAVGDLTVAAGEADQRVVRSAGRVVAVADRLREAVQLRARQREAQPGDDGGGAVAMWAARVWKCPFRGMRRAREPPA